MHSRRYFLFNLKRRKRYERSDKGGNRKKNLAKPPTCHDLWIAVDDMWIAVDDMWIAVHDLWIAVHDFFGFSRPFMHSRRYFLFNLKRRKRYERSDKGKQKEKSSETTDLSRFVGCYSRFDDEGGKETACGLLFTTCGLLFTISLDLVGHSCILGGIF
jgi:hypothetical protein